jgi:GAF domain-containing protein/HAMP domain-containing protein
MESNSDMENGNKRKSLGFSSLQTRLILTIMAITTLAIMILGYFIYNRAQQSNTYLTDQLDTSIRQQAEDTLKKISNQQITLLNTFFASMSRDVANLGKTAAIMASDEDAINNPKYWDANTALFRLPNKSWDNANEEAASVFIPAKVELTESLVSKINAMIHLDLVAPVLLKANPDIIAIYFGGTTAETLYFPNIDLSALVPPDFDVTQRPWFVSAAPKQNPSLKAVWSAPYLDAALNGLVITTSIPVNDDNGRFRGVAAMDIQLTRITQIISDIRVGDTGYAFLIDGEKRLIAMPEAAYLDFGIAPEALPLGEKLEPSKLPADLPQELSNVLERMSAGESDLETIVMGGLERFVIFGPVAETGYSLGIVVPSQELLAGSTLARTQIAQSTQNTIFISLGLVLTILILSFLASLFMGNRLMRPLKQLTLVAEEVTAGNLDARAVVSGKDEIGVLANAFNVMVSQLRDLVGSLEQRVEERTSNLTAKTLELGDASQKLENRASQLTAVSVVARSATTMRDVNQLLPSIAEIISKQFGFYHVGIFLNDEAKQYAVLRATNSEGGAQMLAQGHRLKIGQVGIVGNVASTGKPRIALDTGDDAVFFNNPNLPETKSEMALPLKVGERIIGVLDVQSTEAKAFKPEDIEILSILADQVSIAIENANLFEDAQSVIQKFVETGWSRFMQQSSLVGYQLVENSVVQLKTTLDRPEINDVLKSGKATADFVTENKTTIPTLAVPIKVRGETIGVLDIRALHPNREWAKTDIATAQTIAERLAFALENARLIDESQKRAARERAISDMSSKIGSSVDVNSILQQTVQELGRLIGNSEVTIQIGGDNNGHLKD